MGTHIEVGGVHLAIEAVTDCKNAKEFAQWVNEKNAVGACFPWDTSQAEEVYQTVMATISGESATKAADKSKKQS